MTDAELDAALLAAPAPAAPPLSREMEAMLADLAPVATRRPWRDLARVGGMSLVYAGVFLAILRLRRELGSIPIWFLVTVGVAWFAGFASLLYLALIPRPGSMLPRWRIAGLAAGLVALGFVGAGLMMHPMSPDSTEYGLSRIHHGHWCLEIGLGTALVPVMLGAWALRGAMLVGSRWTAAALGAAGGSLGGLVLHMHCPIADPWHLGLVHGGVVVIAALLAAWLVPARTEPR
jgi:hypothetical protein